MARRGGCGRCNGRWFFAAPRLLDARNLLPELARLWVLTEQRVQLELNAAAFERCGRLRESSAKRGEPVVKRDHGDAPSDPGTAPGFNRNAREPRARVARSPAGW